MSQKARKSRDSLRSDVLRRDSLRSRSARRSDTQSIKKINTKAGRYIVPRVVELENQAYLTNSEIAERERNRLELEDARDRTHHYFTDQLKFKRPKWSKPWFAMMSIVVTCIEVSCVSSFPETVANKGGLAFLLAYTIAMVVFVLPYMYLEGIIGQYFQISMIGIWGICPLFKGLGVGAFATCFLFAAFNPTVTTWSFYLTVEGFKAIQSNAVSWATCNNPWNSCNCDGPALNMECLALNRTDTSQTKNSAALEYFLAVILRMWKTKYNDPGIIVNVVDNGNESLSYGFNSADGLGYFILESGVILAFLFVVILVVCGSSATVIGHIYTFTGLFPVAVLLFVSGRGIGLEGAMEGIKKYMTPDWMQLRKPKFWLFATKSAFFSMSAGLGIHLATASFNPIHHDIFGDITGAIVVDSTIRVLGCLSMFAFVGHSFKKKKKPLPDVYFGRNPFFPFTTFAESVAPVRGAGFFSFIYYLMIMLLVLDTSIIALQTIMYAVYEEYRRKYPDQTVSEAIFLFGTVGIAFSLSMLTMTRGGVWVALFSFDFSQGYNYYAFPAIQAVAFSWIWGLENICKAVTRIYGKPPHFLLRICWKFTCPTILIIFLLDHINTTKFELKEDLGSKPPDTAVPLAVGLTFASVALFLLYTIGVILRGLKNSCGLTLLMLLISPEYEHPEIKQSVWNAKRLRWKHYLFIYSSDELKELSIWQRLMGTFCPCFIGICRRRKARIQVADAGNGVEAPAQPQQQHPDKKDQETSGSKRPSMRSLMREAADVLPVKDKDPELDPPKRVSKSGL